MSGAASAPAANNNKKKGMLQNSLFTNHTFIGFVAGGGSGVISKTLIAPLERVKILNQIEGMHQEPPKYKGVFHTLRFVIKEEGFLALFRGNGANVVRVIPNYGLKFAFNDSIKALVKKPGQSDKDLSFYQMMMSGTMAGTMQICITYPLEVVRTRLTLAHDQMTGPPYRGIMDCFRRSVRAEGMSCLYKGIGPTFISGAPYTGLTMAFYEVFKQYFPSNLDGSSTTSSKLWCGALAGLVAQTVTYPGDTVRRRMQTNGMLGTERVYINSWDACKKIWSNEGWRAFFKGMTANTVRCIPGTAIQFASYEIIKELINSANK